MKRSIILLFSIASCIASFAQKFTGKIEDTGDYYRLTYTVTSHDATGFTPPALTDFEVLSGPNTSTFSSYQMINGKTSHQETTSYAYILSAKKSGKITLGKASIRVNGKTIQSNMITLDARAGGNSQNGHSHGSSSDNQNSLSSSDLQKAGTRITNQDVYIDVTPSRTKVREQEAVLLTYKVHTKLNVGLSQTQLTNKPDFKGMISQEIPLPGNQIQTNIEHHKGVAYRCGTILQYVVFPQSPGKLQIPSLSFDLTILQQREPMSLADAFFNGGGNIGVQIKRVVPVKVIDVEALPQPKPANFSGGVGQFTIKGELVNPEIRTNDIATFRVEVNGVGNMKLITAPKMVLPKDFETYDVKTNEDIQITPEGFKGTLTYDYVFVPQNIGNFEIPSLDFVFFDPQSNSYKTIRTEARKINVKKGTAEASDVNKQLSLLQSDIRTIHRSGKVQEENQLVVWGTTAYFILQAFILALFLVILLGFRTYRNRYLNSSSQRISKATKEAVKQLEATKAKQDALTPSAFCASISQTLMNFIAVSFHIERANLNQESIKDVLTKHHMDSAEVTAILKLIENCQYAQYAPIQPTEQDELYRNVLDAVHKIAALH